MEQLRELMRMVEDMRIVRGIKDNWVWVEDGSGIFNVKSAYRTIHDDMVGSQISPPMKSVWSLKV